MRSRLERAVDKRDDLRDYLSRWEWGMAPSEIRRRERQIDKLNEKIAMLSKADR